MFAMHPRPLRLVFGTQLGASTTPIAHRSPRQPEVASETEIAAVLDRRRLRELADPTVLRNVPTGTVITGRNKILALEHGHRTIDRTLAPTWHARQGVLGSTAKGVAVCWCQRTSQSRDQYVGIGVVGNWHGRASGLRNGRCCAMLDASSDAVLMYGKAS